VRAEGSSKRLLNHGTLLAYRADIESISDGGQEMKIYMLLMLIGVIVGLSYLPIRGRPEQAAPVPPDSLPA
jgi:hypothetical protein